MIATLAIGQGARAAVQAQIRALGANTLTVLPGTITASGARSGMGSTTTLTPDDAVAIKAECPAIEAVAPAVRTVAQVVYGNMNWSTAIQGTTPEFVFVRQWPVANGVFITPYHLGLTNGAQTEADIDEVLDVADRVLGCMASRPDG